MSPSTGTDPDVIFAELRPRLFSIAYRMLGIRAEAEDVVQDAWLRWNASSKDDLQSPEAWLVTIVTRLSIDRLRAARSEREAYTGFWLPEPLVDVDEQTPERLAEQASDLSLALMWVLERLSPEERAAFVLRQAFDEDYADVAATLGKSEAACRQLVHRAAERVRQERTRFEVPRAAHKALVDKFIHAARAGDRPAMMALFADDVHMVSDGGGKVPSFGKLISGALRLANLYYVTWRRNGPTISYRAATINGEPGLLRYVDGVLESAQAFAFDGGRIAAIYSVRNPDKLARIAAG
ncbi:RNA polymerase sigma-70 factor [Massilia terrae]|uniref:RNA polymerase sigma-70 factor n=1 Tax=Massilia terrae TaxID=1811224 RepID=A0ABT2CXW3_9BURK|nr:RNA polymerase sigma-70 factor [Massilia terrae]MCS0658802.1 RNA polymerase sigma-70 factor [Massilia terrae]